MNFLKLHLILSRKWNLLIWAKLWMRHIGLEMMNLICNIIEFKL